MVDVVTDFYLDNCVSPADDYCNCCDQCLNCPSSVGCVNLANYLYSINLITAEEAKEVYQVEIEEDVK